MVKTSLLAPLPALSTAACLTPGSTGTHPSCTAVLHPPRSLTAPSAPLPMAKDSPEVIPRVRHPCPHHLIPGMEQRLTCGWEHAKKRGPSKRPSPGSKDHTGGEKLGGGRTPTTTHIQGSWQFPKPFPIYPSPWKRGRVSQGSLSGGCTHQKDGGRLQAPGSAVLQPCRWALAAKCCALTQGWQPAPPRAPLALLTHTPARTERVP